MARDLIAEFDAAKRANPETIVFIRCGDFYETLREDAKTVANVLGITLTTRNDIPMAGIPIHSADRYTPDLTDAGYTFMIHDPA